MEAQGWIDLAGRVGQEGGLAELRRRTWGQDEEEGEEEEHV